MRGWRTRCFPNAPETGSASGRGWQQVPRARRPARCPAGPRPHRCQRARLRFLGSADRTFVPCIVIGDRCDVNASPRRSPAPRSPVDPRQRAALSQLRGARTRDPASGPRAHYKTGDARKPAARPRAVLILLLEHRVALERTERVSMGDAPGSIGGALRQPAQQEQLQPSE